MYMLLNSSFLHSNYELYKTQVHNLLEKYNLLCLNLGIFLCRLENILSTLTNGFQAILEKHSYFPAPSIFWFL